MWFFFTLALPLGAASAQDAVDVSSRKLAMQSLEAIANKVDDAPALLLLTPSQLEAVGASPKVNAQKPIKNQLDKRPVVVGGGELRELKTLQSKANQQNAIIIKQRKELAALRNAAQAAKNSQGEVEQLKQTLQESLQSTKKMQQELSTMAAAQTDKSQNSDKLKSELNHSQQQSSILQKQLDVLTAVQAGHAKENEALLTSFNESKQKNESLQKQLGELTLQAKNRQQKVNVLQTQLDVLMATQLGKTQESQILTASLYDNQQEIDSLNGQVGALLLEIKSKNQEKEALGKQLDTLASMQSGTNQESQKLAASLNESKQQNDLLQKQLNDLASQKKITEQELRKKLDDLAVVQSNTNQESQKLLTSLNESKQQSDAQQQEIEVLKKNQSTTATVKLSPKNSTEIRDYAIGTSLGNDMLSLLDEKVSQGIEVDSRLALAGVEDAFNGQYKLPQEKISKVLYEMEVSLNEKSKKSQEQNIQKGIRYIESFKKQKGVKKAPSGFYYQVNNSGSGKINPDDTVVVVVKESLTDGKVIKDMDIADTSISQPLDSYPPLFQEAIAQLQNKGNMTLVVPPELAYGNKGLPPDIPPGSTMVYSLRVTDVLPAVSPAKEKK